MREWIRTLLFVSAFSPALITMAYVRFDLHGWSMEVAQLLAIGIVGSLMPLAVITLVTRHGESFAIQAKKIESNDFMLLAFAGSYLVPLTIKGAELSVGAVVGLLCILGLLLWVISAIPAHPILRLLRFRFYKLESSSGMVYTLISRRDILDPREVKAVKKLSDSMLMEDDTRV